MVLMMKKMKTGGNQRSMWEVKEDHWKMMTVK